LPGKLLSSRRMQMWSICTDRLSGYTVAIWWRERVSWRPMMRHGCGSLRGRRGCRRERWSTGCAACPPAVQVPCGWLVRTQGRAGGLPRQSSQPGLMAGELTGRDRVAGRKLGDIDSAGPHAVTTCAAQIVIAQALERNRDGIRARILGSEGLGRPGYRKQRITPSWQQACRSAR
jgi:hypothetical protein